MGRSSSAVNKNGIRILKDASPPWMEKERKVEAVAPKVSVSAFAVIPSRHSGERKFLLVHNKEHGGDKAVAWGLPGGHIEEGEGVISGLRREISGETGYREEHDIWISGKPVYQKEVPDRKNPSDRHRLVVFSAFVNEDEEPGAIRPEEAVEIDRARWFTIREVMLLRAAPRSSAECEKDVHYIYSSHRDIYLRCFLETLDRMGIPAREQDAAMRP